MTEGPCNFSDWAQAVGSRAPLSEERRGSWFGRGGRARRGLGAEIRARVGVRACVCTRPLIDTVHPVYPVRTYCYMESRGLGDTGTPVRPVAHARVVRKKKGDGHASEEADPVTPATVRRASRPAR